MLVLERLALAFGLQHGLVTLYQVKHARRPQALDFGGKLGGAHALDAAAFGLFALFLVAALLLGPLPLGGLDVARQVDDGAVGGFSLAFQLARLAGTGQPLGGVLVVLLAFAAALAGAPLDGGGRWPKVLRWLGVQAAFGVAAVVNLHRVACFA